MSTRHRCVLAAAALLVIACSGPAPVATSTPPPGASPAATSTASLPSQPAAPPSTASPGPSQPIVPPGSAQLSVTGYGHFDCPYFPSSCQVTFAIKPAGWTPDASWAPLLTDGSFAPAFLPLSAFWISGSSSGVPPGLEPGWYRFVAAIIGVSDVVNQDGSRQSDPFATCTSDIVVTPLTTAVYVQVGFTSADTCVIDDAYTEYGGRIDPQNPALGFDVPPMPPAAATNPPRPGPNGKLHHVANSAPIEPGTFYHFDLYTHCGLREVLIDFDGSLWAVTGHKPQPRVLGDPLDYGAVSVDPTDHEAALYLSRIGLRVQLKRLADGIDLTTCY